MISCPLQLLESVKINHQVIQATFIVVEVEKQLPWLGRYWMALLQFDVVTLMEQVTQVHHTSEDINRQHLRPPVLPMLLETI